MSLYSFPVYEVSIEIHFIFLLTLIEVFISVFAPVDVQHPERPPSDLAYNSAYWTCQGEFFSLMNKVLFVHNPSVISQEVTDFIYIGFVKFIPNDLMFKRLRQTPDWKTPKTQHLKMRI